MSEFRPITYIDNAYRSKHQFFKDKDSGTVVKLTSKREVFTIQVVGYVDGSFTHKKQKQVFTKNEWDGIKAAYENWEVATYKDYMLKIQDYYKMDAHYRPSAHMAWDNWRISNCEIGFDFQ